MLKKKERAVRKNAPEYRVTSLFENEITANMEVPVPEGDGWEMISTCATGGQGGSVLWTWVRRKEEEP